MPFGLAVPMHTVTYNIARALSAKPEIEGEFYFLLGVMFA